MQNCAAGEERASILMNRSFAVLWLGGTVSTLGDVIFDTTIVLWIAARLAGGQPWAPLAVTGSLVAVAIPTILIGPVAGVYADRWDKRRTMLTMDAIRVLLILALIPAAGVLPLPLEPHSVPVWWRLGSIYTIVVLATVCAQFFNPSRTVVVADVVPSESQARAASLTLTTAALAGIIGPPLAAPLLFGLGVGWSLVFNALSFALSFLAILSLRLPDREEAVLAASPSSVFREFLAGLHFYRTNHLLRVLLISAVLVSLGGGALVALDVFFTLFNLHAPASWYGILGGFEGAGSLVGAVGAGFIAERLGAARLFSLCLLAGGVLVLVYSRMTAFVPALLVIFLIGAAVAGVNVAVIPLIFQATPRDLLGRVMGVFTPAASLATMVSMVLAGFLVGTVLHGLHANLVGFIFGPVDTVFAGTGLVILIGAVYATSSLWASETAPEPAGV